MKQAETTAEVMGGIRLILSPLAIGIIPGWIVYYNMPNVLGIILSIALVVLGLALGIYWAIKAWNKGGTVAAVTRHMSSPDLDKLSKKETENKK